jgi:hypothetical protein
MRGSGRRPILCAARNKNKQILMEVEMLPIVLKAMPVILPVSALTGIFYLALPGLMVEKVQIQAKGLFAAGLSQGLGFVVGSIVFGALFAAAYLWVGARWPGMEAQIFFKLGIYTFIGFTLLAIVACPLMKMTGRIPVYTLMNLIWAAGYGYFLPQLLK